MTAWGGIGGAGAAVAIAHKLRKIMATFEEHGAVRPESARTLQQLDLKDSRLLRKLQKRGVVVATQDQRYYLDRTGMERYRSAKRTRVLILTAIALAAVLFIMWFQRA
jgi:hypothetical protein